MVQRVKAVIAQLCKPGGLSLISEIHINVEEEGGLFIIYPWKIAGHGASRIIHSFRGTYLIRAHQFARDWRDGRTSMLRYLKLPPALHWHAVLPGSHSSRHAMPCHTTKSRIKPGKRETQFQESQGGNNHTDGASRKILRRKWA